VTASTILRHQARRARHEARRAALLASDTFGQATRNARVLPTFLVVGGQRCGTTSMYKTLVQHPAVLPAGLRKGIHYFDVNYQRGPGWYRAHFPLEASMRRVARSTGAVPQTGESSPYYGVHPLAAERIARDLPDVKLLLLMRDPVERAWSAYAHESARGFETESFERALELEDERLAGQEERLRADPAAESEQLRHHGYVRRGRYIEQLERLAGLVGRDRLLAVDSQDFFVDPVPAFSRVTEFLGLPSASGIAFEQHNARPRSALPDPLREQLRQEFEPWDARLVEWLGWTPSWLR
jgi:hypothetical protein